jgi:HEAT repeat protein
VAEASPATDAAALNALIDRLKKATDQEQLVPLIDEIAQAGQNAKPALVNLVALTSHGHERVRWHAARAVGLIGEDALEEIPVLVALLGDGDPIVVAQAAAAISNIRADDERTALPERDAALYASTIAPLTKTAVHADPRARRAALRALRSLHTSPRALAELLAKQLADADASVVLPALHTLADMGDDAVPLLVESLKDPKSRYWAAVALAEVGPGAAAAVEPLVGVLEAGETEERLQTLLTLGAIGDKAQSAAPAIVKTLEANDPAVRLAAAFALGQMRAAAADAALEKAAAESDPFLAEVAAWARARIHPDDVALRTDAIQRLRAGLDSDRPKVRAASAAGLSDLATHLDASNRQEIAAEFAGLLDDADPTVATSGGAALVRLGADAVEVVRGKLADPLGRIAALEILAAIGAAAAPAGGDLVGLLGDPDEQVRSDAAMALAALGDAAAEAVPALQKILADDAGPAGPRYSAAFALGRIGSAAQPALETLRGLTAADDDVLATVAIWAALKISPDDKTLAAAAIPKLRAALRGKYDLARLEAAFALGDIGPAAADAIPILELVEEDDPVKAVRAAAAQALAKIRGG